TIPSSITFIVFAVPTLSSISPTLAAAGSTVDVMLTGSGFVAGHMDVIPSTFNVSVSNVVVIDSTHMSARFAIALNATPAVRNISVVNDLNDLSQPVKFTIIGPPTVQSFSPTVGYRGGAMFLQLIGEIF